MPKKARKDVRGNDSPLVSIVIPVWNAEKNIKKLIGEIFEQSYANLEVIAIDDGSSDDSWKVLQGLAKEDKRLKIEHQKNVGVSATRNRGIELATGEYLIFVDADDEVRLDFVEKLVRVKEENPEAVLVNSGREYRRLHEGTTSELYMQPRRVRRKKEPISNYVAYLMILDGRMYGMTGRLYLTETIRKNQIRLEEGRDFAEDTKFTFDYLSAKDGEIIFIEEPLYIYNFGTETSIVRQSSTIWANWQKNYRELKDWMRKDGGGGLSLRARALLGLIYMRWMVACYRAKKRAKR